MTSAVASALHTSVREEVKTAPQRATMKRVIFGGGNRCERRATFASSSDAHFSEGDSDTDCACFFTAARRKSPHALTSS